MFKEITVLEIADAWSGPTAGLLLSDFGARVIKVEPPVWKRPLEVRAARRDDPVFLAANRGKESLVLDITSPQGRGVFEDLVRKSDVVLCNNPPSVVKNLGLDYDSLGKINARIICCNISGYGMVGEDVERPAYDLAIQAVSGVMSVTGGEGRKPMQAGILIADERGGMMAALGVLSAIIERGNEGRGRQIDVSMVDNLLFSFSREVIDYHLRGKAGRIVPYETSRKRADYGAYATLDGHLVITAGRGQDKWQALCKALGKEDMGTDPEFDSYEKRISEATRTKVEGIFEPIFKSQSTEHWITLLSAVDIPCAPVNTLEKASLDAERKGMIVDCELPTGGVVKTMANPLGSSRSDTLKAAPRFGEHSREVLTGFLGYGEVKTRRLVEDRVTVLED